MSLMGRRLARPGALFLPWPLSGTVQQFTEGICILPSVALLERPFAPADTLALLLASFQKDRPRRRSLSRYRDCDGPTFCAHQRAALANGASLAAAGPQWEAIEGDDDRPEPPQPIEAPQPVRVTDPASDKQTGYAFGLEGAAVRHETNRKWDSRQRARLREQVRNGESFADHVPADVLDRVTLTWPDDTGFLDAFADPREVLRSRMREAVRSAGHTLDRYEAAINAVVDEQFLEEPPSWMRDGALAELRGTAAPATPFRALSWSWPGANVNAYANMVAGKLVRQGYKPPPPRVKTKLPGVAVTIDEHGVNIELRKRELTPAKKGRAVQRA